jgi:hypothetical protein
MRVGFTGTSAGLTNDQLIQVHMLLGDLQFGGATQATHGMCIGADEQFHGQAKGFGYFVIGVPGVNFKGDPFKRANVVCDMVVPPRPFLVRNRDIVAESDVIIACPRETTEQFRGSGTWATIRYSRQAKKPLVIVWPDGSGIVEHVAGVKTLAEYREMQHKESHERRTEVPITP